MASRSQIGIVEHGTIEFFVATHRILDTPIERASASTARSTAASITAMRLSLLAGIAVLLAAVSAMVISRSVAEPIADITKITEAVAGGDAAVAIPFSDRSDR